MTGAFLLLHLPAAAFEAVVPGLVALAVVLVAVQPLLARRLRGRGSPQARVGPGRTAALFGFAYATGTYGGYFAASQGVLQIGLFGLLLPHSLQQLNALKNVLTLGVNVVAAATYVLVATDRVDWPAAGLVATGSLVGGFLGGRYGRRLPTWLLRSLIVVVGVVAIAVLLTR